MGNSGSAIRQSERESDFNSNDTTIITAPRVLRDCLSSKSNNVDQYIIIWLDETSTDNSLDYDDINIFLNDLGSKKLQLKSHKKLVLITSGSFARKILPKLSLDVISTVIIFCSNSNKYVELKKFSYVTDICTDHETLKNCIQRELPSLRLNLCQTLKTVRSLQQYNSNNYFMYILFLELLKQLPQTDYAKDVMLDKCKDYYRRNESELKTIEEFRHTYKSNQAIEWYTKDSFVYRLLNQAYRTEDITLWFLFRFYIVDLCNQLEKVHNDQKSHCDDILTVYRGQAQLLIKEFDHMQNSRDSLFAINAFWSTSKSLDVALMFVKNAMDTDEFKVVLFQITVDQTQFKNVIFVDIDKWKKTNGESEKEILFTIGTVFTLQSVQWDYVLELWKICITTTDEIMEQSNEQIQLMKLKYQHENNSNLRFRRFLLFWSLFKS